MCNAGDRQADADPLTMDQIADAMREEFAAYFSPLYPRHGPGPFETDLIYLIGGVLHRLFPRRRLPSAYGLPPHHLLVGSDTAGSGEEA